MRVDARRAWSEISDEDFSFFWRQIEHFQYCSGCTIDGEVCYNCMDILKAVLRTRSHTSSLGGGVAEGRGD